VDRVALLYIIIARDRQISPVFTIPNERDPSMAIQASILITLSTISATMHDARMAAVRYYLHESISLDVRMSVS
jgi:hypothetical protein